jgi:hypothetical protein
LTQTRCQIQRQRFNTSRPSPKSAPPPKSVTPPPAQPTSPACLFRMLVSILDGCPARRR